MRLNLHLDENFHFSLINLRMQILLWSFEYPQIFSLLQTHTHDKSMKPKFLCTMCGDKTNSHTVLEFMILQISINILNFPSFSCGHLKCFFFMRIIMMGQAITYGTYVTFTVCCQYHNFMRDFFYYFQTNKFHDITNAHSPPFEMRFFCLVFIMTIHIMLLITQHFP